ncbi:response regulator transcription factor [Dermatophilaceae bacterium Soc4.6]
MDPVIRVAAIDDHPLILQGFRGWISKEPRFVYGGGFRTVAECLVSGPQPDVVVLDVHLDDGSLPVANVRALTQAGAVVVIVSADEEDTTVLGAIEAGAAGYLRKSADLAALTQAVLQAVEGGQPISPELAFIMSRDRRAGRPELTDRERDVLEYFGSGLTWERVAARLGMKHQTVKVHLRNIRAKYRRLS